MNEERTTAGDDQFDEKIFRSMLRNGAAFPTTPDEVREAKTRARSKRQPLPERLRDAREVCAKILSGENHAVDNIVPMPPNEFAEVKHELARAARNGKEALSAKIEERMRLNRSRTKIPNG